jgi:hypothetical protein
MNVTAHERVRGISGTGVESLEFRKVGTLSSITYKLHIYLAAHSGLVWGGHWVQP